MGKYNLICLGFPCCLLTGLKLEFDKHTHLLIQYNTIKLQFDNASLKVQKCTLSLTTEILLSGDDVLSNY